MLIPTFQGIEVRPMCGRWNSTLDSMNEYYKYSLYDGDKEGDQQLPWTTPFCLSVLNEFLKKILVHSWVHSWESRLFILVLVFNGQQNTTQKNVNTIHIQNENSTNVQCRLYMHMLKGNAKPLALLTNVNNNVSSFPWSHIYHFHLFCDCNALCILRKIKEGFRSRTQMINLITSLPLLTNCDVLSTPGPTIANSDCW